MKEITLEQRLDYNLNKDSLIFDIGCNIGDDTLELYNKYHCTIYAFDVASYAFIEASKRFNGLPNIYIFHFGLGKASRLAFLYHSKKEITEEYVNRKGHGLDTSEYLDFKRRLRVKVNDESGDSIEIGFIIDVNLFCSIYHIRKIDLLISNCEGGEIELLESIISSTIINNIKNIQIQFHSPEQGVNVPDFEKRKDWIINNLSKSHYLEWCISGHVENWRLK